MNKQENCVKLLFVYLSERQDLAKCIKLTFLGVHAVLFGNCCDLTSELDFRLLFAFVVYGCKHVKGNIFNWHCEKLQRNYYVLVLWRGVGSMFKFYWGATVVNFKFWCFSNRQFRGMLRLIKRKGCLCVPKDTSFILPEWFLSSFVWDSSSYMSAKDSLRHSIMCKSINKTLPNFVSATYGIPVIPNFLHIIDNAI